LGYGQVVICARESEKMDGAMRIIIPGGTGLIGSALSKELAAHGHKIWILSRGAGGTVDANGAEIIHWDGRTPEGWGNLVNEADAIVNLAGESIGGGRWTKARKSAILESRLSAGQAVSTAVQRAARKPAVVLQASAIGYYGADNPVVTEDTGPGTDWMAQVAAAWEESTRAVEDLGVRRVILRTGLVLSPAKGGFLDQTLLPFRLFVGGPLGSGKQWWSWIHMQDEIGAMRFLLENGSARGPYNLTSPHPVTMAEFGRNLARVIHRPYWMPAPGFALRLLLGEMGILVLGGQKVLPAGLQTAGFRFSYPDLFPALSDTLKTG
jgi:uncharacterized protein